MANFILKNFIESELRDFFLENISMCIKYNKNYGKRSTYRKKKIMLLTKYFKQQRNRIPKITTYMKTIEEFDSSVFYSHFRMNKNTFKILNNMLQSHWCSTKGRPKILEERLYITLWALGNKNSLRELSDRFNKSISTISVIICQTCKLISKLTSKVIRFPKTRNEINQTVLKFNSLRGPNSFPNTLGCIDGTHIPIFPPSDDPSSYYNRKGYHSMILQGVCNSEGIFTDIFFGWPGRSHDAEVFKNSSLGKNLESGLLALPADVHLLGDSAYPLTSYLLVPYRDNGYLKAEQKHFNSRLSSSRAIIEQSFGILKSKFRILEKISFRKIEMIKCVVLASVILHNIIITYEGQNSMDLIDNFEEDATDSVILTEFDVPACTENGRNKRDNLCYLMTA